MRLSITAAKKSARKWPRSWVKRQKRYFFSSRVNDSACSVDVDWMIVLNRVLDNNAGTAALLSARLERMLGGRKVGVILITPDVQHQPIHDVARQTGGQFVMELSSQQTKRLQTQIKDLTPSCVTPSCV